MRSLRAMRNRGPRANLADRVVGRDDRVHVQIHHALGERHVARGDIRVLPVLAVDTRAGVVCRGGASGERDIAGRASRRRNAGVVLGVASVGGRAVRMRGVVALLGAT